MLVGSFIWGSYGLSLGAPAMWVPNATGLAVAIVTVFAINDAEPLDPNVLLVMAAIGTTVAFLQLFYGVVGLDKATANAATGYIGNVVGIVMMCSSAVTWPTMASTGDASALEAQAGMVFAGFANAMAWTALGMLKLRDPLVWLPNILGVACNLTCFGFLLIFGTGTKNTYTHTHAHSHSRTHANTLTHARSQREHAHAHAARSQREHAHAHANTHANTHASTY